MLTQGDVMLQQFGTAVVGIGALFFAYGEVLPLKHFYLNLIIALVGLGATFIVWMNAFGSIKQRKAIENDLKDSPTAKRLMYRYDKMNKWRDNLPFYYRVTRMEMYFSALVFLSWLTILAIQFNVPRLLVLVIDLVFFGFTVYDALANAHKQDSDPLPKPEQDSGIT